MSAAKTYERIGRALMAFHAWQEESGDRRPLTLRRNPANPPSSPEQVADALERLVAAAKVTGQADSIHIDSWHGGPAE